MKDGFDLSFNNKIVRVCLAIMLPAFILSIILLVFTEVPDPVSSLIIVIGWGIFFIWLFAFKRKEKQQHVRS